MDLRTEYEALKQQIAACEKEANEYEAAARAKRQQRAEAKVKLSEIELAINNAVQQQATLTAQQAAVKAQQAAEASKTEAAALVDAMKGQKADMEAKLKLLDEALAKAATPPPAG